MQQTLIQQGAIGLLLGLGLAGRPLTEDDCVDHELSQICQSSAPDLNKLSNLICRQCVWKRHVNACPDAGTTLTGSTLQVEDL